MKGAAESNVIQLKKSVTTTQMKIFTGKKNDVEKEFNEWSLKNCEHIHVSEVKAQVANSLVDIYIIIVIYETSLAKAMTDEKTPS